MPAQPFATSIVTQLVQNGHIAYFAGGWVRDLILQHPSDDIDIATSASVEEIQKLFPKTVPVGVAFGILIVIEGGFSFEVATFRRDRGYIDGRRPQGIEPATPEEDAGRRDFTINGMFYDPLQKEIYDYVGGREDLKRGIIRAIGNPHDRFLEDRLRMMRAVRYSTRFHFPIEPETTQAILTHAPTLFPSVAIERIWQEFNKMAHFAHFDRGLIALHQLTLLPTIFPSLKNLTLDEIMARVAPLKHFPKKSPVIGALLELFPDVSLQQVEELCFYLKVCRADREFALFFHHAKSLMNMPSSWLANLEKIEWAKFYANSYSQVVLEMIGARFSAEERIRFLEEHTQRRQLLESASLRIQTQTPLIRAADLIDEGISPGKKMGLLLREAERLAINLEIEDRKALITLLKNSPLWLE